MQTLGGGRAGLGEPRHSPHLFLAARRVASLSRCFALRRIDDASARAYVQVGARPKCVEDLVPVTAKLSRRFYDQLGDEVANELVEWFNAVDGAYRTDLRELNELNFARFDAKVEQRFAEQDAKWERRFAAFEAMWERRFAMLETDIASRLATMRLDLAAREVRLVGWLFGFWSTSMMVLYTLLHAR